MLLSCICVTLRDVTKCEFHLKIRPECNWNPNNHAMNKSGDWMSNSYHILLINYFVL